MADTVCDIAPDTPEVTNGGGVEREQLLENIVEMTSGVSELQAQLQQLQDRQKELKQQTTQLQESAAVAEAENLLDGEASSPAIMTDGLSGRVQRLERELQARTEERENYKNKLQVAEKQILDLEAAAACAVAEKAASKTQINLSEVDLSDSSERAAVTETLENLTATLKESTEQCERFERQNNQLHSQVKALKEVISVHKDLLTIRGMESDQLKTTIRLLEEHAAAEKERRAAVLAKMEAAVRLNAELKSEYETQLRIFQDLRLKYELKVQLMTAENNRLRKLVPEELAEFAEPTDAEPALEDAEPVNE